MMIECDMVLARTTGEGGLRSCLDRLADHVRRVSAGKDTAVGKQITVGFLHHSLVGVRA
jgi:hypothetical protein